MVNICFYFQVHQPFRLIPYSVFDIGKNRAYFDDRKNRAIMRKVAYKCYLPTNNLFLSLIDKYKGHFKIAFSITGTALEQFRTYCPEVTKSFRELAATGSVEFLTETYYHTLSFLYSPAEFKEQVTLHTNTIKQLFNYTPRVFRNTELIYNNSLAEAAEEMGYAGVLAEGADHVLGWRSPNYVYKPKGGKIALLLKNYKLSDDIAFRFSNRSWKEWPLSSGKFTEWISQSDGETVNLFMDYETFGEHQWDDTGIFNFLGQLPHDLMQKGIGFSLPSEIIRDLRPVAELDVPHPVSWADIERDLSAWIGNKMQENALRELYALGKAIKEKGDSMLLRDWRRLQTSDHFYYMCTKWFADGDVHKYFNPYDNPYDAYITFMNILNDLSYRLRKGTAFQIAENPSVFIKR